jgi:hypothetical protein
MKKFNLQSHKSYKFLIIPIFVIFNSLHSAYGDNSKNSSLLSNSTNSDKSTISNGLMARLGEGSVKKNLIAFPALQFLGNPNTHTQFQKTGADIFQVIQNDLTPHSFNLYPNRRIWKILPRPR